MEEINKKLLRRLEDEDGVTLVVDDFLGNLGEDMLDALSEMLEEYEDQGAELDKKENKIEAMEKHIKETEKELGDLNVVYTKWETKEDRL